MVKVFISHAKERSSKFGQTVHTELPKLFQNLESWYSYDPLCLPQGQGDTDRIIENAIDADFCISLVDSTSSAAPWMNYEGGIFAGKKKKQYCILCGDLRHDVLKSRGHPFSGYHAYPNELSLGNLVHSINNEFFQLRPEVFATQQSSFTSSLISAHDAIYSI